VTTMTAATAGRPNNPWSRSKVVAAPLALAAVILLAWEVSVRVLAVPSYVLPAPSQIAAEIYLDRKIIFSQLGVTLFEIMSGYFLSCVVGFCLSILIVYSAAFRRGVLPLVVASQTIPVIAIAPLLVIWFGYNSIPRIIITALVAFFPLTISFVTAPGNRTGIYQLLSIAQGQRISDLREAAISGGATQYFRWPEGGDHFGGHRRHYRRMGRRQRGAELSHGAGYGAAQHDPRICIARRLGCVWHGFLCVVGLIERWSMPWVYGRSRLSRLLRLG
jgi:hypothetical protein